MSQEAVRPAAAGGRGRARKPRAPRVRRGTEVGSYLVEARLGAGGFGTVFQARRGGQRYALKLLALEEVGEWGVREVLALSRVRHPHVVRLHGFWEWPEQAPCFHVVVMEYVEGRRLDVWTRAENPSALRVLRLLRGAARALVAVHRARMVHRDVKLANLLVREEDGEVVLVDFGVSGWEEASQVTGGMMPPGTLSYRSPEAWRFAREHAGRAGARYHATPADDMYALGCVLYWLLTDALPFSTEEGVDVEAVMGRAPAAPRVRNARVPPELETLCLRLLEKRPEARPDAAAVCEAVEALLGRRGPEWEQALCEEFSAGEPALRAGGGEEEEERWVRDAENYPGRRPRRGRRSPYEVEERAPALSEVAEGAVEPPPPEAPVPLEPPVATAARRGRGIGLAVVLGLLAFSFGGELPQPSPGTSEGRAEEEARAQGGLRTGWEFLLPTWEPGWKVAPPLEPPEAERVSSFAGEAGAPAPVASRAATQHEDEASVKTPPQKRSRGLSAAKKAAASGMLCTTLACAGAPVRPPPPPAEPCPPGAVEAMEKLGLKLLRDLGPEEVVDVNNPQLVQVKEGWTQLRLRPSDPERMMEAPLLVSGRFIFGERVHARFTQARMGEQILPVCLELVDQFDRRRGLKRHDEGAGNTATVFSTVRFRAVDRFE